MTDEEFEFEEDTSVDLPIFVTFGDKGTGKTDASIGLKGPSESIAILSFDHKSKRVARGRYKDENVKVYDAVKYLKYDEANFTASSMKTFNWVLYLLKNIRTKVKPDWILLDGLEKMVEVAEMVMRYKNSLKPYQGFSNLNLWKLRKQVLRTVHREIKASAKKGVIYTTYAKTDELIQDGTLTRKTKVPAWTDIIMEETDVVFHTEGIIKVKGKLEYWVTVTTSKLSWIPNGLQVNITNKMLRDVLKIPKSTIKKPEKVKLGVKVDKLKKKSFI